MTKLTPVERVKLWRLKNPELLRLQRIKYNESHTQEHKLWRAANPTKVDLYRQKYNQTERGKIKHIGFKLRRDGVKITNEALANWIKVNNTCANCSATTGLHVDHCHKTKIIRFRLCFHCNAGLGLFKDDPNLLRNMAKLIDQTTGTK